MEYLRIPLFISKVQIITIIVYLYDQDILLMKALAQDQLRALLVMTKELDCGLNIGIYDGDTPQGDRKWLRDNARLVIATCNSATTF